LRAELENAFSSKNQTEQQTIQQARWLPNRGSVALVRFIERENARHAVVEQTVSQDGVMQITRLFVIGSDYPKLNHC
jgi:hypothetical protein